MSKSHQTFLQIDLKSSFYNFYPKPIEEMSWKLPLEEEILKVGRLCVCVCVCVRAHTKSL